MQTIEPPVSATLQQSNNDMQDSQEKLFDFPTARVHLNRLISDWSTERDNTKKRRLKRDVDVDVTALRQSGQLDEDETLVPVRVIDTNIQREQPAYINYLKNSRRIAIFHSLSNPEQDTQLLEQDFTRGMTYTGWETVHYKIIDGAQTHGWDAVEVVFDESKPLNVGLEHIGHDDLFFPLSAIDIQFSPRIIRKYDITLMQLDRFVSRYGFNPAQVDTIKNAIKNTQQEVETTVIYKLYVKYEGEVFVAWFSLQHGVADWLKAPMPLDLGIKEKQQLPQIDPLTGQTTMNEAWVRSPVRQYPIFILPYRETEKKEITEHKGRVFLDENKQEAQTAILSGFINGLTRASNLYGSPGQEDGTGSSLKQLSDVKMVGGKVFNKPFNFFSPQYPDPMVLSALKYFDIANSQETNQVNFAAMNREDSRKTAKEIGAAQQEQALLNSVQLTLFSTFIRAVYSFAWLIVQSQALQNKIAFLRIVQQTPVINPMTGQPVMQPDGSPSMQTQYVNNVAVISQTFDIRAAGDVDVIQRQEKIMQMKQDWPVIANTPLRDQFLQDLVKLQYPDVGERYAQLLAQAPMMQQLQGMVARLGTILDATLKQYPEIATKLPPEQQADVGQLIQQAMAIAQQTQAGKAQ